MNVSLTSRELGTTETFLEKGQEVARDGKVVSSRTYFYTDLVIGYWTVLILSSLGVVTNSLTMVVFFHQGFRDSVNVSLFSIAVWDEIKCLAGVIYRLDKPIGLINPVWGINRRWMTWQYLVYLPIFSGYVSYALATYVSVERCLSVSIPFKVKSLITPPLTASFMVGLSLLVFGSYSPMFFMYRVEYIVDPMYNASVARVGLHKDFYAYGQLIPKMYKFLGIFYPSVFCTIMIVTSAVIVFHLKKSAENVNPGLSGTTMAKPSSRGPITPREVKVTKMLLVIIFVYVMDFFPRLCKYVASLIDPEILPYRANHNLFMLVSNFIWVMDFTNASVNFFIFMGMSTNFRKTFYVVFPMCQRNQ